MKHLIITLFALIICTSAIAQDHTREKIQAMKIAFMTEKLSLTPGESEKFWPLYNQYWSERRKLAHDMRAVFQRVETGATNGRELQSFFEAQDAETAAIRRWATEFKKVLPEDKVVKVFVSEEGFKRYLLTHKK